MQQCKCQQIFICVQEPTGSFINVPMPGVFNCLTVFLHSLESIALQFSQAHVEGIGFLQHTNENLGFGEKEQN